MSSTSEYQTLKRRILRRWARDGFEQKGAHLFRQAPGLTQIVFGQVTRIGTLQVSLGLFVNGVSPPDASLTIDQAQIQGSLGATDGTRHLGPPFKLDELSSLDPAGLDSWCDYAFDTAIVHFFRVFSTDEECARILKLGLESSLVLNTSQEYRIHLGIEKKGKGAWAFSFSSPSDNATQIE